MRLRTISVINTPPVRNFDADELTNLIVLAGPNGVGKTRLLESLLNLFKNPVGVQNVWVVLESTSATETRLWGKNTLETSRPEDAQLLSETLQKNRKRGSWTSSVINFDADRYMEKVKPFVFQWDFPDPFTEEVGWNSTFSSLKDRFTDTQHSIFRKIAAQDREIAVDARRLMKQGAKVQPLDYPNTMDPFRSAFNQLLSPKRLLDPEPRRQQLEYVDEGHTLPIESLSAGEKEVVNIVFDFLLRRPTDCIVLFDEPELHLHPELSYRLLQSLRTLGTNNQFVLSTHSPDIISSSLESSVILVAPPTELPSNQAIVVKEEDETNQALRMLGHSIGIIALGRKIVLIEGERSSLDKQTYGSIVTDLFPDLILLPSGGKETIRSFSTLYEQVLSKTLWGVDFFMLCDRDSVPYGAGNSANGDEPGTRLRVLSKYHLENYFLDEELLAEAFALTEPSGSWLREPLRIRAKLRDIARSTLSNAVAVSVATQLRERTGYVNLKLGNCEGLNGDQLADRMVDKTRQEGVRITSGLDESGVRELVTISMKRLENSLEEDTDLWKSEIPGRPILHSFASQASKIGAERLKTMYLRVAAKSQYAAFTDVLDAFRSFSQASSASP